MQNGTIVAGLDGSVWQLRPDVFYRLGSEEVHAWDGDDVPRLADSVTVGPDGVLWQFTTGRDSVVRSFDGDEWSIRRKATASRENEALEIHSDGTIWSAWKYNGEPRLGYLDGDSWEVLGGTPGGDQLALVVNDYYRAPLLIAIGADAGPWRLPEGGHLQRHDGADWQAQGPTEGGEMNADIGPEGTIWVRLHEDCGAGTRGNRGTGSCWGASSLVARYDGDGWERFDDSDSVPMTGSHYMSFPDIFEVAADGSLWLNPDDPDLAPDVKPDPPQLGCEGIVRFDGSTLTSYLEGNCIYDIDAALDGAVWIQAGTHDPTAAVPFGPVHLYVIPSPASEDGES